MSALTTLDKLVRTAIAGSNNFSQADTQRLMLFAARGYRDITQEAFSPKTVVLELNGGNYAPLPDDFIKYSKVGCEYCGEIITLEVNEALAPQFLERVCETEEGGGTAVKGFTDYLGYSYGYDFTDYGYYYHNTWDPELGYVGRLFGYGRGIRGQFKIDERNRIIQFSSDVSGPIILEYLAFDLDAGPETYIDIRAEEALVAWMNWKNEEGKAGRERNISMIRYWKDAYNRARIIYINRAFSFTLKDFDRALKEGYGQAPNIA